MKQVLIWMAIAAHSLVMAAEFYVAPSGSDQNPGSRARMSDDIVVHLANGTYPISESVVFDADDSGMNGHKAFPGLEPVVSGGRVVKGWQIHDKEKNIYKASVGNLEFRQIHVDGVRGIRHAIPIKPMR